MEGKEERKKRKEKERGSRVVDDRVVPRPRFVIRRGRAARLKVP